MNRRSIYVGPLGADVHLSFVVEEASVQHGYKNFLSIGADHFGVCKPEDQGSNSYKSLTQFIREVMAQQGSKLTGINSLAENLC